MCLQAKNLYLWLLKIIALLGILALCLWLSLRPKHPNFTILEFAIPSVSNRNSSSSKDDDGTIDYTLEISNQNKDSTVYYDDIFLIFYFGQDPIGKNKIPAFRQGKGDKIRKSNRVDASGQKVEGAIRDAVSKGQVDFKVDLATKIKYTTWGVKSKHHGLNLEGKIPVGSDGKITGKKKHIQLRRPSKKIKLRANKIH